MDSILTGHGVSWVASSKRSLPIPAPCTSTLLWSGFLYFWTKPTVLWIGTLHPSNRSDHSLATRTKEWRTKLGGRQSISFWFSCRSFNNYLEYPSDTRSKNELLIFARTMQLCILELSSLNSAMLLIASGRDSILFSWWRITTDMYLV